MQVEKAVQGMELPSNPLDMLIDQLGGPEAVAEMTGASGACALHGGSVMVGRSDMAQPLQPGPDPTLSLCACGRPVISSPNTLALAQQMRFV